ncbi:MAG TPA: dolichyl-phosphate-mannose--protein mannosyltransferase [Cytophagales bacterium]|jgi:4-amino-4-deoxy-L-arabinose transferase-like glycosyltransferase|nr:dolichyl-phosphate-mannose--protein mannosyltransferase [Cytophagales bacterium]
MNFKQMEGSKSGFLSKENYIFLFSALAVVYIAGLFIPLMENDAAQFSVMALRMHQLNDYVNLVKGTEEYLDKPHMHFWLAAFSYKVFGVHDWAYRIPALLFTVLGAFSTFGLGKLLYNKEVGRLAALIFVSAQAIILANHDVRTDAVLTGATVFAIWQFAAYIRHRKASNIILGAAGMAVAFSTKGQIAVFVAGIAILCDLIYTRKWKVLWSWKVIAGIITFFAFSAPMLYAYYLQFDLHPEKFVNGKYGNSGVWFILWRQSFERLAGERGMQENSDFFFFHHSFIWAFLPWSLITFAAIFNGVKRLIKAKFQYKNDLDFLTLGGFIIAFHVFSLASFKLPHYINILFPLAAVITAQYLYRLFETAQDGIARIVLIAQYVVVGACVLLLILLNIWAFPIDNIFLGIVYVLLLGLVLYLTFARKALYQKIILMSAWLIILVNFMLNTNFYPKLLEYQGGSEIAEMAKDKNIDPESIYILEGRWSRSLNFYLQQETPSLSLEEVRIRTDHDKDLWIFGYNKQKQMLEEAGIKFKEELTTMHFMCQR